MKRIVWLILLTTALSSPASARAYSFVVRGHRVHIPSHCRSLSCISVSGIGNLRRGRHDDDVATVNDTPPAPAAPPAPAPAPAIAPPPTQPVYAPPIAQVAPPAPAPLPPVSRAQSIPPAPTLAAAPPAPAVPSVGFEAPRPQQSSAVQLRDPVRASQQKPQDKPQDRPVVEQPVPSVAPPVARVAQADEDDDSPAGDWQTEGRNGLVRIESCGDAYCGYALNATTKAKGETVLVNMKAKKASQWAGNIYSRSSGNSYYGTMTLKEGNSLRVEACALGSYFCSGNTWTRFEDSRSVRPADVANTRQNAPRS
jgi:uncharacterized protein (DUF2147 family)